MEAVGGHNALLGMHNPVGRKEWRVVTEGSARDRLTGDGSMEHSRVNGSARMRPLHADNPRNGRIFHSGASSGSSSDSDHHTSDANQIIVASHESLRQNGEDIKLYDEALHIHEQEPASNGHSSSLSNGLPLDFGGLNSSKHETLEQRLHDVIRQREQLQRLEAELRAQFIARSEIIRVQNSYDEQTKQHASVVSNLQEQLQERDHRLHELEQKLEERERQLHANQKEASEAVNQVWAKDGLLREQTSELATLRRERETLIAEQKATLTQFEADRAQLLSRLQDLEEQIQEKERQLQEIDEQHRTAQETLAYKDEQLREAQAWVQRAQELDAFYANTHNSLHAELRDRNEQINQLWLGQQRQLAEVERYHSQTIQRLRMEVAEAREQNRMLKSGSSCNIDSKSEQSLNASSGDNDHSSATDASVKLRKGVASGSNQVEHTGVLPVPASPVLGATAPVLAGNPIPVLHQFAGQPQGMLPTIPAAPAHITQSTFSNPVVMPAQQHLPLTHQQALHSKLIQQPQSSQRFTHPQPLPVYSHFPETKSPISIHPRGVHHHHQQIDQQSRDQVAIDQGGMTAGLDFSQLTSSSVAQQSASMQLSVQAGHVLHQESSPFVEKQVGQAVQEKHVNEEQNLEGFGKTVALQDSKEQQFQQQQEEKAIFFDDKDSEKDVDSIQVFPQHPIIHQLELPTDSVVTEVIEQHHGLDSKVDEQQISGSQASGVSSFTSQDTQAKQGPSAQSAPTVTASVGQQTSTSEGNGKSPLPMLLDEKSLLACLVRAIPSEASARIKISTTLPNRLGKMLAPLHWHDYKRQYGRLDDFISSHPKLFVIDGDFVHLREGAHAIISATTAVAKVAAAAAAPSSLGTNWPPTVAITPVSQSQVQRTRKNTAPVFMVPGSASNHTKQEILFSHVQMNGGHRLHQGFLSKDAQPPQHQQRNVSFTGVTSSNGSKLMSALGSRTDGIHSGAANAEFVDASSIPYGASTAARKTDMIFGGRQGARPHAVEPEPFARKEFSGLSQSQENRIPRSS
ncbi:hypothetical protein GOP47_0001958 [Adiantum capillus-veneris]|uniref:DUF7725 domain-containing protein n=1 Tax=Adiantum capillus-veneris TaxID=13818 RepID=A0A9D4V989_ADICA|nr:hypothetical protein GOP47_0001958 [Adiantum capillus-veneris]